MYYEISVYAAMPSMSSPTSVVRDHLSEMRRISRLTRCTHAGGTKPKWRGPGNPEAANLQVEIRNCQLSGTIRALTVTNFPQTANFGDDLIDDVLNKRFGAGEAFYGIHLCMCPFVYMCILICTCNMYILHPCTYIKLYLYTRMHTCTHEYMHTCTHAHMHPYRKEAVEPRQGL
jgi:hypothetical protein